MSSTAARNRQRGNKYESDLRAWLSKNGYNAFRQRQAGKLDEGDLSVVLPNGSVLIVEAKSGEMKQGPFVDQATEEAQNFLNYRDGQGKALGVAVVKRRMKGVGESFVLAKLDDFLAFLKDMAGDHLPQEDDVYARLERLEEAWLNYEAEREAPPEWVTE